MTIGEFDNLSTCEKERLLFTCCGSHQWVKSMLQIPPAQDLADLLEYAEENWFDCNHDDWLEAFMNNIATGGAKPLPDELATSPKVAMKLIRQKDDKRTRGLEKANDLYEETFGYKFISFADEKPDDVLLAELNHRLNNDPREEILVAAVEQDKITRHLLKKIFS